MCDDVDIVDVALIRSGGDLKCKTSL